MADTDSKEVRSPISKSGADADRSRTAGRWRRPDVERSTRAANDLEAVFDVPVHISAVLGRATMRSPSC